jgi:hypothetical protein
VQQLLAYEQLTRDNTTYLWYFPDGRPSTVETSTSPDAMPTDGWGSSAMLYALMEGLAGIVDDESLFRSVRLAPRWTAADCASAQVTAAYGASGASFGYAYTHDVARNSIALSLEGTARVRLHLLLPDGGGRPRVRVNGRLVRSAISRVEQSRYVDVLFPVRRHADVTITLT